MGPNGSEKRRLSNILTDNLKADSGEITYNGENVLELGVRFREKLGFLPQNTGMYPRYPIDEFWGMLLRSKD